MPQGPQCSSSSCGCPLLASRLPPLGVEALQVLCLLLGANVGFLLGVEALQVFHLPGANVGSLLGVEALQVLHLLLGADEQGHPLVHLVWAHVQHAHLPGGAQAARLIRHTCTIRWADSGKQYFFLIFLSASPVHQHLGIASNPRLLAIWLNVVSNIQAPSIHTSLAPS